MSRQTKLLERKTGSSDIRSRDALIVLKVDRFIYCPTNHGKWRGFSLSLFLSLYPFLHLKLFVEADAADFDPVQIFSTIDRGCKRPESSNEGTRNVSFLHSKRFKEEFHKEGEGKGRVFLRRFVEEIRRGDETFSCNTLPTRDDCPRLLPSLLDPITPDIVLKIVGKICELARLTANDNAKR